MKKDEPIKVGDMVLHKNGTLDARRVVSIDYLLGTLTLWLLTRESDPLPIENYVIARRATWTAKPVSPEMPSGLGTQRVYRLDPPLQNHEYVLVSAADVPYSGPETYIFPATPEGEITDYLELDGSFKGCLDFDKALANAGYTVTA